VCLCFPFFSFLSFFSSFLSVSSSFYQVFFLFFSFLPPPPPHAYPGRYIHAYICSFKIPCNLQSMPLYSSPPSSSPCDALHRGRKMCQPGISKAGRELSLAPSENPQCQNTQTNQVRGEQKMQMSCDQPSRKTPIGGSVLARRSEFAPPFPSQSFWLRQTCTKSTRVAVRLTDRPPSRWPIGEAMHLSRRRIGRSLGMT